MLLLGLVAGAAALRYRAVVTNEFRKRDLAAPGQPISGFKEQKLRAPQEGPNRAALHHRPSDSK